MTHARLTCRRASFSLQAEFSVGDGVTALVGPAGAGKSLILELIAGFTRPDAGRILVQDAIVFDADAGVNLAPARRRCAHVASRDTLFPHLSVRENLMFAASQFARLERHKRVAEISGHFGLDDTAATRVAARIARAILSEPRLLLIDECGMDERLLELTLQAFPGPVLLVTSDLDLCHACGAHLMLLEAGVIVQSGPARETMDEPASVSAAKLLGFDNIFSATVSALDPGRNTSVLDAGHFALAGPYLPGRFNGDRVQVAVRARDLRLHGGGIEAGSNCVCLESIAAFEGVRTVRLHLSHGISAELPREQWLRQGDNQKWQVEFPSSALRVI